MNSSTPITPALNAVPLMLWCFVALTGASSVLLEAYFSHGLSAEVSAQVLKSLETAASYQRFNSLVMVVALLLAARSTRRWRYLPASCFALAILSFSGGIYAKHLLDIATGSLTPTGGVLMALGWLLLARLGWLSGAEWSKSR
ncbi:Uncharacterized membrane protein YgdD, TMEM256/DUF423 family [Oceanospirillum multiglobuliferum]|uniref:DUF423 domain-containing protein n=1 Tax=Oceanospirillum multiglobuliferum TaxID=64969 RepID=UPI0009D188D9|nr:DUF423 domain-containing protein [Oceanospirillum multiglobuliferum]SKA28043.1 Uncharacterized membrane protein YgdD, TMEM256/DUF423 family [Oceanospirillum multiglobuliferum]